MKDEGSFANYLETMLSDDDIPFTDDIASLSDLDHAHLDRFQPIWNKLSPHRRQLLLAALGQQAIDHIELQFDRVNEMALDDLDAGVRRIAISNLWESQDPKLATVFLKLALNDPSSDVKIEAIQALGRFILLGQLNKIKATLLAKIEDDLLNLLVQEDLGNLHSSAIEALGYSCRPEVEGIIQSAFASTNDDLRQSALIAMGRSANELWEEHILAKLESHSPDLRSVAALSAGQLELRSAVLGLIELLDDVNDDVRTSAVWSLGQIGGGPARKALETLQSTLETEALAPRIQEALEHIAFLESTPDFLLINFDEDEDELY